MEYCNGGSVLDILKVCKKTLIESQISAICACIAQGIAFLHKRKIFHRDIKAGNILLSHNSAKLADFGVSVRLDDFKSKRRSLVGSSYWMAPEVINIGNGYGIEADIWSLGITAIEMANGKPPHHQFHHGEVIFVIPESPPPTLPNSSNWSDDFHNFVTVCLQKDPVLRPSADQLLQHPFIVAGKYRKIEIANLVDECASKLEDFRYSNEIEVCFYFSLSL